MSTCDRLAYKLAGRDKNASKILDDFQVQQVSKVGSYWRPANQRFVIDGIHKPKVFPFDSFPSNALVTGKQVLQILKRELISRVVHLEIQVAVSNSSGSNLVTLAPTTTWCESIEIYNNDSQAWVQRVYDVPNWTYN